MIKLVTDRLDNWTILPAPPRHGRRLVHPDLAPEAALEQLWEEIVFICRLDDPDPAAGLAERMRPAARGLRRARRAAVLARSPSMATAPT